MEETIRFKSGSGPPGPPSEHGFTMVELLVAIFIFGLAIAPLATAFFKAGEFSVQTRRRVTATLLARQKLGSLRRQIPYRELNDDDGRFPAPNQEFGWDLVVQEYEGRDRGYGIKLLRISITYPSRSGEIRTVRCTTVKQCHVPDMIIAVREPVSP